MSGPKRLFEEGTNLERLLIASGRSVHPNRMAKARVGFLLFLSGMGIAPAALSAVRSSARVWLVTKWLAVGIGAGTVAFSATRATHHDKTSQAVIAAPDVEPARSPSPGDKPSNAELATAASAPTEAILPGAPPGDNAEVSKKDRPVSELRAGRESVPTGVSMEEIREIDGARRAIEAGDPRGALQRLDRYAKNHPKGALEQEHLRLRVEALAAQGDMDAARSLLRRFLARYPQSAHRKRLQSLVGGQP